MGKEEDERFVKVELPNALYNVDAAREDAAGSRESKSAPGARWQ
jgi:hypothetical protein